MTFTKEQISQAFIQVLNERVPDLSDIPDHVFSERFEKKMNKLIRKEAAHPWAVSHTLARNLIAAAIVIILLFTLCMSVGAIRNAIFNFFQQHFEDYDRIVFEVPEKTKIEKEYIITNLPEGFELKEEIKNDISIMKVFQNENGDYIHFSQELFLANGVAFDNEHSNYDLIEIDNHGVFISTSTDEVSLTWDQDGYIFLLILNWEDVSVNNAITIYRAIQPAVF